MIHAALQCMLDSTPTPPHQAKVLDPQIRILLEGLSARKMAPCSKRRKKQKKKEAEEAEETAATEKEEDAFSCKSACFNTAGADIVGPP